jgi:hypothetical protein
MFAKLRGEQGKACDALRKQTVEPTFGQLKEQQGARRFTRRGLAACDAEWKLLCGTHNLAQALATPPDHPPTAASTLPRIQPDGWILPLTRDDRPAQPRLFPRQVTMRFPLTSPPTCVFAA